MKKHNIILESNVEPKDKNVLWLQGNKLKKFGKTGWEDIIEGGVVTTDRIENGAVTTDKIATNAFDSTLSKSEKIAPANIVGNKITMLDEKVDALALGKFYGYFPDSTSFPTDVSIPGYAYVRLGNSYKIWNFSGESWSDSGVSIDENDVIITTDRIADGAVTTEKIATTAFDSTLSVSGKIAPADVVGGKLSELDTKVNGGYESINTYKPIIHDTWNKYIFVIPFDGVDVGIGIKTKIYCKDVEDGTYDNFLCSYNNDYKNTHPSIPVTFINGYAELDGTNIPSTATGWRLGTAGTAVTFTSDSRINVVKETDGLVEEAPKDGKRYVRVNGEWKESTESLTSDKVFDPKTGVSVKESLEDIKDRIDGRLEERIVEEYQSSIHTSWGKYMFVLPFDGSIIGKGIKTLVKFTNVPDGTYDTGLATFKNTYTSVLEYFPLVINDGYAELDGTLITRENATGWRIGYAKADNPITEQSILKVVEIVKVSEGIVGDINKLQDFENKSLNFYNPEAGDYYQKMWSTMHCTPIMLKEYLWFNKFNWNLNICLNTDSHNETPEIFARINRWYKCFGGRANDAIAFMWTLGDSLSAVPDTKQNKIKKWQEIYASLDRIGSTQRPQLFTIGNHDLNHDGSEPYLDVSQFFTREDRYNCIIKPMLMRYSSNHTSLDEKGEFSEWNKLPIVTPNVEFPTMWMLDMPNEKLRCISLDCYDWEDSETSAEIRSFTCGYYSSRQVDFLIDCLNSVPNGYAVVVGRHHPYSTPANKGYMSGRLVMSILTAYRNKTTFTGDLLKVDDSTLVKTYSVDFSNANGRVFSINGHDHIFSSRQHGDTSIGPLTFPAFTAISTNAMGAIYRGVYQDQFDILCYNDEEGIRFARYGGVGSRKDCKNDDGGDADGFHFVDAPVEV